MNRIRATAAPMPARAITLLLQPITPCARKSPMTGPTPCQARMRRYMAGEDLAKQIAAIIQNIVVGSTGRNIPAKPVAKLR
ncbi:MAG: hypothetical protein O3C49_09925 [Proteobacteria bacterium]|nr:hypothetical protein [Pseudomonadota bacterium]MDA1325212.1 hypothetical protein [Pseudomonadota bacterium]